jgi:hypothetical protein
MTKEAYRESESNNPFMVTKEWYAWCKQQLVQKNCTTISIPDYFVNLRWGRKETPKPEQILSSTPTSTELRFLPTNPALRPARARIVGTGPMTFEIQPANDSQIPVFLSANFTDKTQYGRLVEVATPYFDRLIHAEHEVLPAERKNAIDEQLARWYERIEEMLLDKGHATPSKRVYWSEKSVLVNEKKYAIYLSLQTSGVQNVPRDVRVEVKKLDQISPKYGDTLARQNTDQRDNRVVTIHKAGDTKSAFVLTDQVEYTNDDRICISFDPDKPYTSVEEREAAYLSQFITPVLEAA